MLKFRVRFEKKIIYYFYPQPQFCYYPFLILISLPAFVFGAIISVILRSNTSEQTHKPSLQGFTCDVLAFLPD